ncbi:hypothetical protein [Aliivibrio fischeri]|uniref:Nucleotidyltransferase n=1 Tax=Aliivibrio fischeri SR5 TaxID=1088719 RepID=A0AAV3EVB8_ALIFS|nr:hypothetical protein [Aliivibrio fischeri]EHN70761.1 hypothetical protein VFSR5_1163 [Aliivibrio fischeri SR5]
MATQLSSAINEFLRTHVNLDSNQVKQGRASRDWLLEQLESIATKNAIFPPRFGGQHRGFGSFRRSTKKQPLDDIDQMFCFSSHGDMHYSEVGSTVYINVGEDNLVYKRYVSSQDSTKLSSIRIVNLIVNSLNQIPQYSNSASRNSEAATLKATSYPWNFDIVPCFMTSEDASGNTYYLIPDGYGNWKKTDPRKDTERSSTVNQNNDKKVLQIVRLMKYWNKRPTMATMTSYLLENMILDYYEANSVNSYIDWDIKAVLRYISNNIFSVVQDPKGIQGNLNVLTYEQQVSIQKRANDDIARLQEAGNYEFEDPKRAINLWRIVFGNNFPTYG